MRSFSRVFSRTTIVSDVRFTVICICNLYVMPWNGLYLLKVVISVFINRNLACLACVYRTTDLANRLSSLLTNDRGSSVAGQNLG